MGFFDFLNDRTGAHETVHGSDGRANVSSRSDSRAYYNSRDENKMYSLTFDDDACTAGDDNVVLFNNDVADKMVIHSIIVGANKVAGFKVKTVTGTAGGGAVSATPVNMHIGEADAVVTASTVVDSDDSPISGLTDDKVIAFASVPVSGTIKFDFGDTLRLAKGQGLAVETDIAAADTRVYGSIFFYFESD